MSVQTHLASTASKLILTTAEDLSIIRSISTLQRRLGEYFSTSSLLSHFKFGSYTRDTILPRKVDVNSDIDYMLVFDNSSNLKPQAFLDRLKKFVVNNYSTSEVYQSHPTIVLELNHIKFELVPAYQYSWSDSYRIPSRDIFSDNWIDTDPVKLKSELTNKNTNNNSLIKPLVRLLKYWNVREGKIYSSYEIERFVIDNYFASTSNLKSIFYEAIDDLHNKRFALPDYKRYKVERAKTIIDKTRDYENSGLPISAETEILKLIPDYAVS